MEDRSLEIFQIEMLIKVDAALQCLVSNQGPDFVDRATNSLRKR
jgi:hypothetical protein